MTTAGPAWIQIPHERCVDHAVQKFLRRYSNLSTLMLHQRVPLKGHKNKSAGTWSTRNECCTLVSPCARVQRGS